MSENTPHIIHLLRRWLSGDIRAAEERELDRAANEDPFLRDALDAYRRHPEADHGASVERIRGRLEERRRRSGGGYMRWLPRVAAAAAVLLLIGATLWFINLPGGDTATLSERDTVEPRQVEPLEPEIAAEETSPAAEPDIQRPEPSEGPEPPAGAAPEREQEPITPAASTEQEEQIAEIAPPVEAEEEEAVALETPSAAEAPAGAPSPAVGADSFDEPAAAPAAAARRAFSAAPAPDTLARALRLTGQILTVAGAPVADAQVQLPGSGVSTFTDSTGRFQLQAPPQQQQLFIRRPGYSDAAVATGSYEVLNITLEESETPVTRERNAKRLVPDRPLTEAAPAIVWPPAQPEVGFEALEKYIDANRQYPEAAAESGLTGTVHLQFAVQPDGTLTNFQILQSPGEALSREAIRLLQEGPAWTLPEGRRSPMLATYRIEFTN